MREAATSSGSRYVLDSFALLTFLQEESGWERVRDLLQAATRGEVELHMSLINMAEVRYMLARRGADRPQVLAAIEALPITIASADRYIESVIRIMATHPVSLADCFAAAVAAELGCPVVTGDREFKRLKDVAQVEWLP